MGLTGAKYSPNPTSTSVLDPTTPCVAPVYRVPELLAVDAAAAAAAVIFSVAVAETGGRDAETGGGDAETSGGEAVGDTVVERREEAV